MFELTYQLDILPSIWKYYKTPAFKRLMTIFDELTRIIMSHVDAAVVRLEKNPTLSSEQQSVLEKLLKVDRNVALVMVFDMLLAGVDTTSSGSTGVLYCLAKNPEKQARLREELRSILPKKDSPLTPDNMKNLPYLKACIKEGLRLYPPAVGNLRAAGKDLVLQGYRVPKGVRSRLISSLKSILRSLLFQTDVGMASVVLYQEDQHFARGKEFLPERWLKDTEGCPSGKTANPFLFLPFGFGPRMCIGRRMAMMEMEMIVARVTRQFEYRWNYGELHILSALVNIPKNELRFQMTEVDS